MRAYDDAIPDAIAGNRGESFGHEWRGFADGNHAKVPALQSRADRRVLHGARDEVMWRGGFDSAARDS